MEKMRLNIATQVLVVLLQSDKELLDYSPRIKRIACQIALKWADMLIEEEQNTTYSMN